MQWLFQNYDKPHDLPYLTAYFISKDDVINMQKWSMYR